ncbi:hypothetical protein ILUMI_05013 [Ignelater luminosus]|uniref:DDE Tnp4 domain-containing protein n=1 Tax=Ignelater luminosus TaxID=2038154 RepID=A0A8K0DBD0_IGNLU|nr:hypothetical protein ILUMI_05013 [Ignelater luminosus]
MVGVFKNTSLYERLQNNMLQLSDYEPLPNREKLMPYVIVADDAFSLGRHNEVISWSTSKRIFNYRTSRARRIVEYVFGIMSAIFRVLRKPMLLEPEKAQKVVLAGIYLHNFLRNSNTLKNVYTPRGIFDSEDSGQVSAGSWRNDRYI